MPTGVYERPAPEVRFWSKVEKTDTCWLWTGSRSGGTSGADYGVLSIDGRGYYAHRFAYELLVGPIPAGLVIDHVRSRGCQSTLCVNPSHLEAVTQAVNVERAKTLTPCPSCARPIHSQALHVHVAVCTGQVRHCVQGHEFTPANTYTSKRGSRECRRCHAARQRARRARLRLREGIR